MKNLTRIALILMLPATFVAVTSQVASARLPAATGSVTCNVVKGSARFSPPLSAAGSSTNEAIRFRLSATGCAMADGSNLTSVMSHSFRITMRVPSGSKANACATALPVNGTIPAVSIAQWKSQRYAVTRTVLGTTGEAWDTSGSNVSVSIPGNGSASNNGTSFAGVEGGANSTIQLSLALTGTQYAGVCNPTTGRGLLHSSMVTGGTIKLGPSVFTGFTGSAAWVAGSDPLAGSHNSGQVLNLDSPQTCSAANSYTNCSYAGITLTALNGLQLGGVSALSFDFAVQTPSWSGAGGGSPRIVVLLSDGGNVQLDSEGATLTTGTWVHLDAMSNVVDNVNGTNESCGTSGITWSTAVSCHGSATITSVVIVNDSGWEAPSGFDVWVDNVHLNNTVVSAPL